MSNAQHLRTDEELCNMSPLNKQRRHQNDERDFVQRLRGYQGSSIDLSPHRLPNAHKLGKGSQGQVDGSYDPQNSRQHKALFTCPDYENSRVGQEYDNSILTKEQKRYLNKQQR